MNLNLINFNNIILIIKHKSNYLLNEKLLSGFIKSSNINELIINFKNTLCEDNNELLEVFVNDIKVSNLVNYLIDINKFNNSDVIIEKINIKKIINNITNDNVISFFDRLTKEINFLDVVNSNLILVDKNYNLIDGKYKLMKFIIDDIKEINIIKLIDVELIKQNKNNIDHNIILNYLIKNDFDNLNSYYNINKLKFNKINFIIKFLDFF